MYMGDYRTLIRQSTPEEFIRLRRAVGWQVPGEAAVTKSLGNTLHAVCAMQGEACVGCGRVVGDGALVFYLQDIMVHPDHQRLGIGSRIMDALMAHIDRTTASAAVIALFAAPAVVPWYERYGFVQRPDGNKGPGMVLYKQD